MAGSIEPAHRRRLVIFLKEPRPGRVKTRLALDIGSVRAAHWHRRQCLAIIRRMSSCPHWQLILAVSPDIEGIQSRVWPSSLPRIGQGRGGLGDRMARVMRSLPPGPAAIIGSDIPGASPALVERAFRQLGRYQAVFGPSPDGGYWLVGLKRTRAVPPALFRSVRWSTEHTLQDSIESLGRCKVALADVLQDVDTIQDLHVAEGRKQAS